MKKSILLSLALGLFLSTIFFIPHIASAKTTVVDGNKGKAGAACSGMLYTTYFAGKYLDEGTKTVGTPYSGKSDGNGGCVFIAFKGPAPLNVEVPNPVPNASTYTYAPNWSIYPPLPTNDPITIGQINPGDGSHGNSYQYQGAGIVSEYNTIIAQIGSGSGGLGSLFVAPTISWPADSIFNNLSFWNKPLAYTFQVAGANNNSKWYPLNYFTFPDPTSRISSLPTVPVNISWDPVTGAAKYQFTLISDNPLDIPDSVPTPPAINVQITSPRNYSFPGHPSADYTWSATPLDSQGNIILAPETNTNNTGYTADPFFVESSFGGNSYCGIDAGGYSGHQYFTNNNHLFGDCHPSAIVLGGTHTSYSDSRGYHSAFDFIEWNKIPGAVNYEIQYALAPIPDSTPFTNTSFAYNNSTITASVATVAGDLWTDRPGIQYDFSGISLQSPSTGYYWRVRGLDSDGQVVRNNLVQGGIIKVPLSKTPYQSAYLNWPRVSGATSYVIDVAEKAADFDKLPFLTTAEIPLVKTTATLKINGTFTSTPQLANTTPVTDNIFLLRRVVPNLNYDTGDIIATHFKKSLKEARIYIGFVYDSNGVWDYDGGLADKQAFDEQAKIDTNNFTNFSQAILDTYYPLVFPDNSMTAGVGKGNSFTLSNVKTKKDKASLSSNQIEITTSSPITVTNKSTGNAKLIITQSSDKKTTTLTFTTQSGPSGEYAFNITKNVTGSISGGSAVIHPLAYTPFGPMPVIGSLTGKAYAEFDKLLPNQTYYWRVRALKDPQVANPNSTAAFTWYPWSTIGSFVTSTGLPASVNIVATLVDSTTVSSSVLTQPLGVKNLSTTPITAVQSLVSKNLSWNATPTATSYNVEVYLSPDLTVPPFRTLTGITTTSANLINLHSGTTYYFVIRAVNAYGIGPKNPIYSFVATPTLPSVPAASVTPVKN